MDMNLFASSCMKFKIKIVYMYYDNEVGIQSYSLYTSLWHIIVGTHTVKPIEPLLYVLDHFTTDCIF